MVGSCLKGQCSMSQVLVKEFPNLADLKQFVAMASSKPCSSQIYHCPHESSLQRWEICRWKYSDLQDYMRECSLSGDPQVKFWQVHYGSMYSDIIEVILCCNLVFQQKLKVWTNKPSCLTFHVFIGDQATCKTIWGAKEWVEGEVNEVDKLKWAHEVQRTLQTPCAVLLVNINSVQVTFTSYGNVYVYRCRCTGVIIQQLVHCATYITT